MRELKNKLSKFGKVETCKLYGITGIEIKITEGFKNNMTVLNEINSILLYDYPLLRIVSMNVDDGIFHLIGTTE